MLRCSRITPHERAVDRCASFAVVQMCCDPWSHGIATLIDRVYHSGTDENTRLVGFVRYEHEIGVHVGAPHVFCHRGHCRCLRRC